MDGMDKQAARTRVGRMAGRGLFVALALLTGERSMAQAVAPTQSFAAPWDVAADDAGPADDVAAEPAVALPAPRAPSSAARGTRPLLAAPSSALLPGGDRQRAIECMTAAIAYEAGHEPLAGQEAVAQVILNRVRHPRFPKSVCGVVFDGSHRSTGCQFTFTCDGSLSRRLRRETVDMARVVAVSVIDGLAPDRVLGATHYHANYVNPYWASAGTLTARIGAHLFYRMPAEGGPGARKPLAPGAESGLSGTTLALLDGAVSGAPAPRANRPAITPAAPGRVFAPWGLPLSGTR